MPRARPGPRRRLRRLEGVAPPRMGSSGPPPQPRCHCTGQGTLCSLMTPHYTLHPCARPLESGQAAEPAFSTRWPHRQTHESRIGLRSGNTVLHVQAEFCATGPTISNRPALARVLPTPAAAQQERERWRRAGMGQRRWRFIALCLVRRESLYYLPLHTLPSSYACPAFVARWGCSPPTHGHRAPPSRLARTASARETAATACQRPWSQPAAATVG